MKAATSAGWGSRIALGDLFLEDIWESGRSSWNRRGAAVPDLDHRTDTLDLARKCWAVSGSPDCVDPKQLKTVRGSPI
jgi:hypothetical protein